MPPRALLRESLPAYRCIVGLTGSIASGKSHAREYLASLGAVTVDADRLGHAAYRSGTPCFDAVVREFGGGVVGPDGEIDRKALGGIVFESPERLAALNRIVWPAIEGLIGGALGEAAAAAAAAEAAAPPASGEGSTIAPPAPVRVDGGLVGVVEAAVLLEAGWGERMDEIWVTWVPPDVAVGRLVERNGLAPDAAAARLQAQMPLPARLAAAGVAVCTAAPKETTRQALRGEWERLLARLRGGARGGAGDSPG